jgi:MFS family permease
MLSTEAFNDWGWRVPFWVSILLVILSYFIRKKMEESPVFEKAKAAGNIAKNPIKESFGKKQNFKFVLLALFGATMGQGVVWYTGQFYAMSFMEKTMNVDKEQVDSLLFIALICGTPFFVFFGWLSDKIGRKWIMMAGMLFAILAYRPIYESMYQTTNLANKSALIVNENKTSSLKITNEKNSDSIYVNTKYYADGTVHTVTTKIKLSEGKPVVNNGKLQAEIKNNIHINDHDKYWLIFLVFIQVIFVTMVYGPIAAFLVELFPTKIRYTSMSLPYHIGNGVFGGLLPAVATYLVTNAKDSGHPQWYLQGLWYPIGVASICLIIGVIYISSTSKNIDD